MYIIGVSDFDSPTATVPASDPAKVRYMIRWWLMLLRTGLCCTRHGHKDFVGPPSLQLGQTEDTSSHQPPASFLSAVWTKHYTQEPRIKAEEVLWYKTNTVYALISFLWCLPWYLHLLPLCCFFPRLLYCLTPEASYHLHDKSCLALGYMGYQ